MSSNRALPLHAHLEELRRRLIVIVGAVVVGMVIAFFIAGYIFAILKSRAPGVDLIYIGLSEMIGTYFKVVFWSGVALALPVIIYEVAAFVLPALTPPEKKWLFFLVPALFLGLAAGVAFCYFVLLPPALQFLLTFGGDIARPQIRVGNYISVVVSLLFWSGVVFETPVITFFLAKIGVLQPQWLSQNRRLAFVGAFVLGAIITPTFDPINQTLVAGPLIVLYEISIWLAKLAYKKRPASALATKIGS